MTLCPYFNFFTSDESDACQIAPEVDEDILGPMSTLPGCNPVQQGPQFATNYFSTCTDVGSIKTPQYFTDVTHSLGWSYVGCGNDTVGSRTFTGAFGGNSSQTVESCIGFCSNLGFTYAGVEYADECYCANSLPANRAPLAGVIGSCSMACAGNPAQVCGGSGAISIYTKCTGSSCNNIPYVPLGNNIVSKQSPQSTTTVAPVATSSLSSLRSSTSSVGSSTSSVAAASTISSTAASSSVSATSQTSSTAVAPVSTFVPSCPSSNGLNYTTSNGAMFTIQCSMDHVHGDLSLASTSSYAACMTTCSTTASCVGVSYVNASPNGFCYMKNSITSVSNSGSVWSAVLQSSPSSTKTTPVKRGKHRRGGHGHNLDKA